MVGVAAAWYQRGRRHLDQLKGAAQVLAGLAKDLPDGHPIRARLESQTVAELSLEELVRLVRDEAGGPAALGLLDLQLRAGWIERFAQFSVHLGILGTVLALMMVDGTDAGSFRSQLPLALGTTFFGLIGALLLGAIGGGVDGVLEQARVRLRLSLLVDRDDD